MVTRMAATPFPVPPLAQRIFAVARDIGCEARIVGGAVRDWVLMAENSSPSEAAGPGRAERADIDMAIACPIADAMAALRRQRLKIVETGLAHGTITVLDQEGVVELTQTRVDLETDGRHAVVGFTDDWAEDARRRDFTVNALYVTESGHVEDPLGGLSDLAAGRLRFVGDARTRIAEDGLRMLRYCRFLPRFGQGGADPEAVKAIGEMAAQAGNLSGERVARECRRLFQLPDPLSGAHVLHETGLDQYALGVKIQPQALQHLPPQDVIASACAATAETMWLLRMAVCLADGTAGQLVRRLRLSRAEGRFLATVDAASLDRAGYGLTGYGLTGDGLTGDGLAGDGLAGDSWWRTAWFMRRDGHAPAAIYAVLAARQGHAVSAERMTELANWTPPQCPVTATDLLSHGVDKGPVLGDMLDRMERRWVTHDFTLTKEELLATIT